MRQVLGGSITAGSLRRTSRSSDVIPRAAQVPGVFSDPWAPFHTNSGVQATIAAAQREPCWGPYPAVPCRTSRLRGASGFKLVSHARQNSNPCLEKKHQIARSMPITTQPCSCEPCNCKVDPQSAVEKDGKLYCSAPCADGHAGNDTCCTNCECC